MLPVTRCFLIVLPAILGMTACEQPSTPPDNQPEFGSLSGLVLDQETELPIADAMVTALKNAVADTTDNLGAFLLDNLALGTDTIMATLALYDTQYSTISIPEGPQQVTIYLHLTDTTVIPNPTLGEWFLLGLESESITAIAVDPFDENVIYAGSTINYNADEFGGLFKSADGGASWNTLISGTIIRDIDIHPTNPQIIYVLGGGALVSKTADGGQTWVAADSGLRVGLYGTPGVLAIDPLHPDTLYTGVSSNFGGNLFKSTDGGRTWRAIGDTILWNGVTAIAIDPQNTNVVYAGTAWIGAISKSTDGGASWERMDFPEVGIINDLIVHPSHTNNVYTGTWRYGFYFSTNGGTSWENANTGLPDTVGVRRVQLSDAGHIYIAANDMGKGAAYLRSQDEHWTMIGAQTFVRINTIAVSRRGAVYAGVSGIYVLSD